MQTPEQIVAPAIHLNGSGKASHDPLLDAKVNPQHYKTAGNLQPIDVIEAFGLDFCKGNAVKYLLRAGHKHGESETEDLSKALWYIERRLAQLTKGD